MKYGESDSDGMWNSGVSNYPPAPEPPFMGYPMQLEAPPMPVVAQTPSVVPPPPPPPLNIYINGNCNAVNAQCYPIPPNNVSERRDELPCCGVGLGWLLFIIGFFLGIPWYAGFFLLLCNKEPREKPGFIACTIAAGILTVAIVVPSTTS